MLHRSRYTLPLRLRTLFRRPAVEKDLDEEMSFHMEKQVEHFVSQGMSESAARLQARRTFGNLALHQEECRDARKLGWLESLGQDVRQAYRSSSRHLGFTSLVIATLALGIAATATLFSIVDVALLKPVPLRDSGRLVFLAESNTQHEESNGTPQRLADWQQARSFSAASGFYSDGVIYQGAGGPVRLEVLRTFPGAVPTFLPSIQYGRAFTTAESRGEGSPVALLTQQGWRRHFQADPAIVNRNIRLDSASYQVIGILGPETDYPESTDLWSPAPLGLQRTPRQASFLSQVARLAPGVTFEQAQAEISLIAARLAQTYPATDAGRSAHLIPLQEQVSQPARAQLLTLFAAVTAVLLIACVNIAGLMLGRGLARRREAAIRVSLGAGFLRLARMFFLESLLLAAAGCILGLLLSFAGISVLKSLLPPEIPRLAEASLDGRVVLYAIAISLVSALVFGGLPAWQFAAGGQTTALKEKDSRSPLRSLLVIAEVALSLILLVTAALLANSFFRLTHQPAGFDAARAYSFSVPFAWNSNPAIFNSFTEETLGRLQSAPGTIAAGVVDRLPLHGGAQSSSLLVAGTTLPPVLAATEFSWRTASPGYFPAIGIPLLSGALFHPWNGSHGPHEAVISQRLAQLLFADQNPIGHQIAQLSRGKPEWFQITGIVGDTLNNPSDNQPAAEVYVPWGATYWPVLNFVLRTNAPRSAVTRLVHDHVQSLTSVALVENLDSLDNLTAAAHSGPRTRTMLISGFAVIALALSAIGLFGLLSNEIARHTQDYGVRIALGAAPRTIAFTAMKKALLLASTGLLLGLGASYWTSQLLTGLLFGVEPSDPPAYLAACGLLLVTAAAAALVPARRAARIDPVVALRHE